MTEVIVVIGAGSIGQAIARRVSAGKHVVLADLHFQYDDEWLARTAALFLGLGFAAPLIEERAREIAAVATRERFAALDAHAQGRSFRGRPATRRPHHARPPRLRAHAGAGRSARGVAARLGALFVLCGLAG
jgi:hypothetical protein